MKNPKSKIQNPKSPRGFTLTELLVVMLVISILAALTLSGLSAAVNDAKATRTKTVINKIDSLIDERWEAFRTRAVPLPRLQNVNSLVVARSRLYVLRELMRMEMPDRRTDIVNFETTPPSLETTAIPGLVISSLQRGYFRMAVRARGGSAAGLTGWTRQHESSECLYLILATIKDGDKSALDYFSPSEIGDVDGDLMKEVLDGWGQPIAFLRWAPGYTQQPGPDGAWGVAAADDDGNGTADDVFEAGWPGSDDIVPVTLQTRIAVKHPSRTDIPFAPDPYDPVRTDPRWAVTNLTPFALKPLIFSAGLDKSYDVATALEDSDPSPPSLSSVAAPREFRYSQTSNYTGGPRPPNDPYFIPPTTWATTPYAPGTVGDLDGDGYARGWADNITNHDNTAQ